MYKHRGTYYIINIACLSRPEISQQWLSQLSYRDHHGTIIISLYDRSTEFHPGKAVWLFVSVGQPRNCCWGLSLLWISSAAAGCKSEDVRPLRYKSFYMERFSGSRMTLKNLSLMLNLSNTAFFCTYLAPQQPRGGSFLLSPRSRSSSWSSVVIKSEIITVSADVSLRMSNKQHVTMQLITVGW